MIEEGKIYKLKEEFDKTGKQKKYLVLKFTQFKDLTTRGLVQAVNYQDIKTGADYVRCEIEFEKRFKRC